MGPGVRRDDVVEVATDTPPRPRGTHAPELIRNRRPSKKSEGAGNAGRASAPIVSREKKTHEGRATGSPETHRHSLRDGFTVSFVLSPEIGLVVSVAGAA